MSVSHHAGRDGGGDGMGSNTGGWLPGAFTAIATGRIRGWRIGPDGFPTEECGCTEDESCFPGCPGPTADAEAWADAYADYLEGQQRGGK